jgi:hypothetical protein
MALSADLICGKIPGLTYKQRLLCAAKPDAMVAISNGAKLGLAECQEQFKYHRWNCTAIGSRNGFGHVVVVGKNNQKNNQKTNRKTFLTKFLLISSTQTSPLNFSFGVKTNRRTRCSAERKTKRPNISNRTKSRAFNYNLKTGGRAVEGHSSLRLLFGVMLSK